MQHKYLPPSPPSRPLRTRAVPRQAVRPAPNGLASVGMLLGGLLALILASWVVMFWAPEASADTQANAVLATPQDVSAFHDHWSQGRAEITSYELEQARYGDVHPGHAVLIFVTEDFSRQKHVKLDAPQRAGADRAPVLKLNATRKFHTGVYPYSVMSSIFTPVDGSGTLKVSTSVQEWCGHVYSQLNREGSGFRIEQRSYFESEGDVELDHQGFEIEDDLWTRLRLNPQSLPTGSFSMLPSSLHLRLRHLPWQAVAATGEHLPADDQGLVGYRLTYPEQSRSLTIRYSAAYPHEIESWQETVGGLTTRAVKKERLMLDYWSRNRLEDAGLRERLGL